MIFNLKGRSGEKVKEGREKKVSVPEGIEESMTQTFGRIQAGCRLEDVGWKADKVQVWRRLESTS